MPQIISQKLQKNMYAHRKTAENGPVHESDRVDVQKWWIRRSYWQQNLPQTVSKLTPKAKFWAMLIGGSWTVLCPLQKAYNMWTEFFEDWLEGWVVQLRIGLIWMIFNFIRPLRMELLYAGTSRWNRLGLLRCWTTVHALLTESDTAGGGITCTVSSHDQPLIVTKMTLRSSICGILRSEWNKCYRIHWAVHLIYSTLLCNVEFYGPLKLRSINCSLSINEKEQFLACKKWIQNP